MLISASLFSCNSNRKNYIHKLVLNGIKIVHIDYIEDETQYDELIGLKQIKDNILFDIHMICKSINRKDIILFNSLQAKYLCYQYENLKKINWEQLNTFKGKKGMAFTMETPIKIIEMTIKKIDFILIMCTVPGKSGQKFNYDNIKRINYLRQKYPQLEIHVDGGIEAEKSALMSHMNVSLIVTGSFFANANEYQLPERICELKYASHNSTAEEIMLPISILSIVDVEDDLLTILYALNQDKLSTVIVKENDHFIGIITDGDIRRKLLQEKEKSFSLQARDVVNKNPISAGYNDTVNKLLYEQLLYNRTISAIPCKKNSEIIGLIDMNHL